MDYTLGHNLYDVMHMMEDMLLCDTICSHCMLYIDLGENLLYDVIGWEEILYKIE